ncbi:DUF4282 domain-containing protein [Salinisphaera aquimarina]|uniref:DUF4282 domain-containing protein n=1 Tax=Salinisphaera aquimarina TaxID=2094031 RepID=A0ABV7EMG3_9GAMM
MKDILYFDSMLTPKLITFIYWLFLLMALVSGLGQMSGGYAGPSTTSVVMGLVTIVGGAVAARVSCELIIVIFKIHENLKPTSGK